MEQPNFTIRYRLNGRTITKTFESQKQLDNFVRKNDIAEYYDEKGTLHLWIIEN